MILVPGSPDGYLLNRGRSAQALAVLILYTNPKMFRVYDPKKEGPRFVV